MTSIICEIRFQDRSFWRGCCKIDSLWDVFVRSIIWQIFFNERSFVRDFSSLDYLGGFCEVDHLGETFESSILFGRCF